MSLQVCHCGWSKVTSHHGLRTHQGKMGCTPRGDNQKDIGLDDYAFIKIDKAYHYSDMDHQVCHCGWSKYTTYHGLRTHQGMMGCTPKGVRIPRSEQFYWRNQWKEMVERKYQPAKRETAKKEEKRLDREPPTPAYPVTVVRPKKKDRRDQTLSQVAHNEARTGYWSTNSYTDHPTAATIKEPESPIPQRSSKRATKSKADHQLQDFPTPPQMYTSVREHPTPTYPVLVVERNTKKKDRKDQTLSEARREGYQSELQKKIQEREEKMSQIRPAEAKELAQMFAGTTTQEAAVRQKKKHKEEQNLSKVKLLAQELAEATTMKGSVDAEWLEIKSVFSEVVRVAEDPQQKSLDLSLSTLRNTTSTMVEQIHQKLERMSSIELKWISKFAVDVKMDPTTAHRCLVSADGKKVSYRGGNQKAPGRFGNVLGLNRLTSGKSYWEVVVSNKTGWNLGVARGDANRRGKLSLNPGNGYWVTEYYDNKYKALTTPPVELSLKEKPQKVGVFVDSEEGLVSFYNVTARSHIYSFTGCSLTGEIYPYFNLHLKEDGESADPLIISTVEHQ